MMELGEKDFSYYWAIIMCPLLLLVLWNLAALVTALVSYSTYRSIFSWLPGLIVSIAIYGFIGWSTIKDHKGKASNAGWAGALTGAIAGVIGAALGLVMIAAVPAVLTDAMARAGTQAVSEATMKNMMLVGGLVGFVTGPLFGGLVGGLISWIAGLIALKN
ncbi:MAG: hypothetical protein ABIF10_02860 [Candidatus Woesearchaeota archaeon]